MTEFSSKTHTAFHSTKPNVLVVNILALNKLNDKNAYPALVKGGKLRIGIKWGRVTVWKVHTGTTLLAI
jgi:hypothetical protein